MKVLAHGDRTRPTTSCIACTRKVLALHSYQSIRALIKNFSPFPRPTARYASQTHSLTPSDARPIEKVLGLITIRKIKEERGREGEGGRSSGAFFGIRRGHKSCHSGLPPIPFRVPPSPPLPHPSLPPPRLQSATLMRAVTRSNETNDCERGREGGREGGRRATTRATCATALSPD